LNTPTTLDNNTSEIIKLPNGFNATVVNTYYLFQGKFHAFMTRGSTNTNDYQDLVFLITKYFTEMSQYNSNIDIKHRQAFLAQYAAKNAANQGVVDWMRQTLGLAAVQQQSSQSQASGSNRVWDATYGRSREFVNGGWRWL
jgi:predicted nucleotidyltransferase